MFGILGGILFALGFGYAALGRIKRSGGTLGGRGLAVAGITLRWIWLGILGAGAILVLVTDPPPLAPGPSAPRSWTT